MRLLRSRENDAPARVGVVGDVHACDDRLARLLDHLREVERVDAIWCVGDIVNGPGDPDRCAALLVSAGAVTVRGNHDRWLVDGVSVIPDAHRPEDLTPATHAFLAALPPSADLQELLRGGRRLVIKGHRHRHAIWRVGDLTLVDAGALLHPDAPCAVVVDASARTLAPLRVCPTDPAQPF